MDITLIGKKEEPASTICISGLKYVNLEIELKNLIYKQNCKEIKIIIGD